MRVRRIFRPSLSVRLAPLAGGVAACILVIGLVAALPSDLLGSSPDPASAAVRAPAGTALVIDAATLKLGDQVVRLYALSVPERGQATCRDERGTSQDCAVMASAELARLVAERDLECQIRTADRMGRAIGLCSAGGIELAASLVAAGWAYAERGAPIALSSLEAAARAERRGVWAAAGRRTGI
jgi:endonuclease YncB( thermonuclease family)